MKVETETRGTHWSLQIHPAPGVREGDRPRRVYEYVRTAFYGITL